MVAGRRVENSRTGAWRRSSQSRFKTKAQLNLLRPGQIVSTERSRVACSVVSFIGAGGQGEVYLATMEGRPVALKWYYPHYLPEDPRLGERLRRAAASGPPGPRFLWPLEIIVAEGVPSFGYVMPARDPHLIEAAQMFGADDPPSLRTTARYGFELSNNFRQLHARGFCYADINDRNVFVDPRSGDIAICDNDNVDVNGTPSTMIGTPRFRAPEVALGKANAGTSSDLHSLAVMLFVALVRHHPFDGAAVTAKTLDATAVREHFERHPIFIFDPDDASNRPHARDGNPLAIWPVLPLEVRNLFTRAFTTGLRDPENGRVTEGEWRSAMLRLHDSFYNCERCGAENFYDFENSRSACFNCHAAAGAVLRLCIERETVVLNGDTTISAHHVDVGSRYDLGRVVAAVESHPAVANVWGLKNLDRRPWQAERLGTRTEIGPGRSVRIVPGTRIDFGGRVGTVEKSAIPRERRAVRAGRSPSASCRSFGSAILPAR
jgi:eukaryotic-like serine/threonine-protein kinase